MRDVCAVAIPAEIEGVNGERWGSDVPCETDDRPGDDVLKGKGGSEGGCGLPSSERLLLLFENTASQLLPLDLDEWRLSFMQDVHRIRLMVTKTDLQSAQTVKPAS